ncbi:MAG: hypothetical protein IJO29_09235 [Oscillospiraceae bacterium]|nr:hypothetical protein [Oscillospiraceae bacterium]
MRCWQTKGLLSVSPETLYFYCRHYPPTNAPRSPVCRSVPLPDKLPHSNSEGTNRLQSADRVNINITILFPLVVTVVTIVTEVLRLYLSDTVASLHLEQHILLQQPLCALQNLS